MAKQRFCTKCGAPLSGNERFCTRCGAPLDADTDEQPVASSRVTQPISQPSGQPTVSSQVTQQMPQMPSQSSVVPPQPVYSTQPAQQQSPGSPKDRKQTAIIVACVVIIVAAIAVVLVILHPWSSASTTTGTAATTSSTTAAASTAAASTAAASTSAASTAAASTAAQSTDAYYSQLSSSYSQLGSLDSEIASAANDFNQNYLSSDTNLRSSNAQTVNGLVTDSTTLLTNLQKMNIPTTSKNYACWQNQIKCANDCVQRATVIKEAWQRSLSISVPTEDNADYICQPLSRDNDSSGHNTYKNEFDSLYPSTAPTQ